MLHNFKENKNVQHFILHIITFMVLTIILAALGPFLPYISARTGIVETKWSFLFSYRSFGMTLGCLVVKYFKKLRIQPIHIKTGAQIKHIHFDFLVPL